MGNTASTTSPQQVQFQVDKKSPTGAKNNNGVTFDNRNGSLRAGNHYRNSSAISEITESEASNGSGPLPSLHESLMRQLKNRDPHRQYEIIKILGEGSMGSVSKVRKRADFVGGSARTDFLEQQRREKCCFGLPFFPCPIPSSNYTKPDIAEPIDDKHAAMSVTSDSTRGSKPRHYKRYMSTSSIITYGKREQVFALKSIHLERVRDAIYTAELKNEISILQSLDHPSIVKAIETFEYQNRLYLLLEMCSGGDLYARDPYTEGQAMAITYSLLDAIVYMHSRGIVHRDLKYENIMFATPTSSEVKIIDFGLSAKYADYHMHDAVGTVYTMAPEVLKGDYNSLVDVWSVGVIAFMLLSSSLPFYGKTRQHVIRRIVSGKYAFKGRRWLQISKDAKEFIEMLLQTDAKNRPTAAEALKHSWLAQDMSDQIATLDLMEQVQASIRAFSTYGTLKKLALLVIAYKSTDDEIGFLRKVFRKFDSRKNGEISVEEFEGALCEYHYSKEELRTLFDAVDIDGTGMIHYSEFLAATIEAHGSIDEERLAEAFDRLDNDDSGYISVQNLRDFLGNDVPESYLDKIIDEADLKHDHQISYEEFIALWDERQDDVIKDALVEVGRRRKNSTEMSLSLSDSGSVGMDDSCGAASSTSTELGGNYFFGLEKEKSVRGVWV